MSIQLAPSRPGANIFLGPLGEVQVHGATQHTIPSARAWDSTTQSIPNDTETALTLNSESSGADPLGMHSLASNTSRMTVPGTLTGTHDLLGSVRYDGNATGVRQAILRKNGTTRLAYTSAANAGTGSQVVVQVATSARLVAGDYVELTAYQNSGGALGVIGTEDTVFLSMQYRGL